MLNRVLNALAFISVLGLLVLNTVSNLQQFDMLRELENRIRSIEAIEEFRQLLEDSRAPTCNAGRRCA